MIRRADRPLRNVCVSFEVTRFSAQHLIDAYADLVAPVRRERAQPRPGRPRAAEVKGTAVRRGEDLVRFHVRRNTFVVADDFWLAFYFWDRRRAALFPECWLVTSRELARRTAHQRDVAYLTVDTRLDRSVDRWAEFRCPIQDQAAVLRGALRKLRAAA